MLSVACGILMMHCLSNYELHHLQENIGLLSLTAKEKMTDWQFVSFNTTNQGGDGGTDSNKAV